MYSMGQGTDDAFMGPETLILNADHDLVKYLVAHKDSEHADLFAHQLYDLAEISNQPLSPEALSEFIKRSNEIMMLLAK